MVQREDGRVSHAARPAASWSPNGPDEAWRIQAVLVDTGDSTSHFSFLADEQETAPGCLTSHHLVPPLRQQYPADVPRPPTPRRPTYIPQNA